MADEDGQSGSNQELRPLRFGSLRARRFDLNNLDQFLRTPAAHVMLSVPLFRQLSPDSLSVMEFKCAGDGLIAHFYGLTKAEFAHVLSTFPLVPDPIQIATQNAYRDAERGWLR